MHVDKNCCVPPSQVSEQGEDSLQDDQVGHDCVLQDLFLLRSDSPLSKNNGSWLFRVYANVKSGNYHRIKA